MGELIMHVTQGEEILIVMIHDIIVTYINANVSSNYTIRYYISVSFNSEIVCLMRQIDTQIFTGWREHYKVSSEPDGRESVAALAGECQLGVLS